MVRSGFVTAWRLATSPTSTSPDLENPTTDGVVRAPSALAITVDSPPSRTATTEFVVPRSMPTALAMLLPPPRPQASLSQNKTLVQTVASEGGGDNQSERMTLKFVDARIRAVGHRPRSKTDR